MCKIAAEKVGGTGGGKPHLAHGGGNLTDKLDEALKAGRDYLINKIRQKKSNA